MAEFIEYPAGTPSWVDLGTTDIEGARSFYNTLFGWDLVDQGPDSGGYQMAQVRGKAVAGLGPAQDPGPPRWTTYVTVDDVDDATARVREAGGSVLLEPMDVLDVGRMAVFGDPTGVAFSVWQAKAHHGAQLVNEPSSFCWTELNTRDTAAAKAFYEAVFGWKAEDSDGPMQYTELKLDGKSIAGMMDLTGRVPDEVPAHWLVYFAVEDCDKALATAQEAGGQLFVGPIDTPAGRFGVVSDPQGAVFAVIQMPTAS